MNMNSNLKERSITISCEEGIKGCTKVIDYKGTKINYSIPPFKERKKVFLVEQDNLMFKLLVEKADGRYKAASGIKCFLLIIFFSALMGETLNILMSIILTFLIGYPISTFILDRITGNNRW